ncbi:tetratricopeptide repeat protein [Rubrivivax rivuli]|nr:tetratricopeptide repeat protein [Rubrivivax rivuli]
MSHLLRRPAALSVRASLLLCSLGMFGPATSFAQGRVAAAPAAESAPAPVVNSAMDDRLFYQLLVGEMALGAGDAGSAYELMLDAARRTRDDGLFRRAADIALRARAGDQALAASRAWRLAKPDSADAARLQLQILLLMNRPEAVAEPLRALLALTPAAERPGLISVLPRFLQRAGDARAVARLTEDALKPYRDVESTRVPVRIALGRAWLEAGEPARALELAREAQALEPSSPGPALLGMELMRGQPAAESLVLDYLKQPQAEPALRLAYVRVLTTAQRYPAAVAQLQTLTQQQPDVAQPYLSLGALQLELKNVNEGEAALRRYVELAQPLAARQAAGAANEPLMARGGDDDGPDDDDTTAAGPAQGLVQAWLMLAQAAEQRRDFAAAEAYLAKIDDPRNALDVQTRRASILARQGKIAQAREIVRSSPERGPDDARAKLMAEAGVLRDVKRWAEAYEVLGMASQRFNTDADILYEQAMMAEKLDRLADMERLLRRVMELKPDNAHAYNALGYSLAERKLRLPEARELIQRALQLAPGDPFITDSLGWVEFQLGNLPEAARLLRLAYGTRPDTEIAAHLGEVLWTMGQRDEARRVLREARSRDAANEVLRETLARLRVDL